MKTIICIVFSKQLIIVTRIEMSMGQEMFEGGCFSTLFLIPKFISHLRTQFLSWGNIFLHSHPRRFLQRTTEIES